MILLVEEEEEEEVGNENFSKSMNAVRYINDRW